MDAFVLVRVETLFKTKKKCYWQWVTFLRSTECQARDNQLVTEAIGVDEIPNRVEKGSGDSMGDIKRME